MKLIPEVKYTEKTNRFKISGCKMEFPKGTDERVIKLSKKIPDGKTKVSATFTNGEKIEYKMNLSREKIEIEASNSEALFYALQTIRQIIKNGYCDASRIEDAPDFKVRGFYFDITRGRIPTLDTLKELVDNLSYCKINMLQLYVEHVFPFKEYDGVYQRTGYMTPEETRELDEYCYENYIELVPSLSCFGHLYELLSTEKYKHLCELENYKEQSIFWQQRMQHHTIDPSNEESFEVIKSLIDQYAPLFRSDKFNICGDETFDLCTGRNKGKDKGRLYIDFVKKIIAHVKSKGKKPMMWADVATERTEYLPEIDSDVTLLSWRYDANPSPAMIHKVKAVGREQYVCPGISNWTSLIEITHVSIPNITKMAQYGYEAGAKGLLVTCWGDYGHLSPIYASMYGTLFAASKAWNVNTDEKRFEKSIDLLYYGYKGAGKIVKSLSRVHRVNYWYDLVCDYSNRMFNNDFMKAWNTPQPDVLNEAFNECEEIIPYLMATKWENERAREALLLVAEGVEYMIAMIMSKLTGEKLGVNHNDVTEWIKNFSRIYLSESKEGELAVFVKVFYELSEKYLK